MLVQKTLNFSSVSLKMDSDSGRFSGYASVWGGIDSYGDTILKGAFKKSLAKATPKMFYNHDWSMPIGKWEKIQEDEVGLFVEGELTKGIALSGDVKAAMKHGTLDGLSIGGYIEKDGYEKTESGRIIKEWASLMEISPVVFPADKAAKISSVKNIDFEALLPECKSEKDIERLLRDSGLGRWEAMAIVSRLRELLKRSDSGESNEQKTHAQILARISSLPFSQL